MLIQLLYRIHPLFSGQHTLSSLAIRRMQKNHSYSAVISSPIGKLGIDIQDDKLCNIDFLANDDTIPLRIDASAKAVCNELKTYFQNGQHHFTAPLLIAGTPFQKKVWQALCQIPPGTTLSYGELAAKLATSPRAIGNACRANATPIVVPCHRIVAKQGTGGFVGKTRGAMTNIKEWLLAHEKGA
jgi:methylated-DNA-[protein]-cysteine S-methyltransferase